MNELHFPFLECMIFIPLIGAAIVSTMKDPYGMRKWSVVFTGFAFCCAILTWRPEAPKARDGRGGRPGSVRRRDSL